MTDEDKELEAGQTDEIGRRMAEVIDEQDVEVSEHVQPRWEVFYDDGRYSYVPAPEGTTVGSNIELGTGTAASRGNVLSLESIPDGTTVCNIEKNAGDGGKLIKAAGSSAIVFAHGTGGVTVKFPSGKFLTLNAKCRAMIGAIAGAGRKDKPFLKAGSRAKYMQAHGRLYPTVRGIAQAAVYQMRDLTCPFDFSITSTTARS